MEPGNPLAGQHVWLITSDNWRPDIVAWLVTDFRVESVAQICPDSPLTFDASKRIILIHGTDFPTLHRVRTMIDRLKSSYVVYTSMDLSVIWNAIHAKATPQLQIAPDNTYGDW